MDKTRIVSFDLVEWPKRAGLLGSDEVKVGRCTGCGNEAPGSDCLSRYVSFPSGVIVNPTDVSSPVVILDELILVIEVPP